ncbi:sulfotransferase [Lacinutrix iliipiscaria]|uniref:Sulfotransferase n=1 Tax=Lacinutrix iliipiscaria TaxID=1230532 RepID=A0ABW5WM44_9FLAO
MSKKKHKVIVVGLPKTGTSTLAVMLRMLNYKVTGPDANYKIGDLPFLNKKFNEFDGFQDFPWCFEWDKFLDNDKVKYIILNREKESWWKSFYESYGRKQERYLSYPFFKISKELKNKPQFLNYFDTYYETLNTYAAKYPERFLSISIKTFEWQELCDFLDEDLPTNMLGQLVKKPHVNKERSKNAQTLRYKITNQLKKKISSIIGKENWRKIVIFFRKNGVI